jgi:hypothetical protein
VFWRARPRWRPWGDPSERFRSLGRNFFLTRLI